MKRMKCTVKPRDNDFNKGLLNMMQSALAADWYEKRGKPLPLKWKKRLEQAYDWLKELSGEDYARLIS